MSGFTPVGIAVGVVIDIVSNLGRPRTEAVDETTRGKCIPWHGRYA
jgi:hypothetical protein